MGDAAQSTPDCYVATCSYFRSSIDVTDQNKVSWAADCLPGAKILSQMKSRWAALFARALSGGIAAGLDEALLRIRLALYHDNPIGRRIDNDTIGNVGVNGNRF